MRESVRIAAAHCCFAVVPAAAAHRSMPSPGGPGHGADLHHPGTERSRNRVLSARAARRDHGGGAVRGRAVRGRLHQRGAGHGRPVPATSVFAPGPAGGPNPGAGVSDGRAPADVGRPARGRSRPAAVPVRARGCRRRGHPDCGDRCRCRGTPDLRSAAADGAGWQHQSPARCHPPGCRPFRRRSSRGQRAPSARRPAGPGRAARPAACSAVRLPSGRPAAHGRAGHGVAFHRPADQYRVFGPAAPAQPGPDPHRCDHSRAAY